MRTLKIVLTFGLVLAFAASARAGTIVYSSMPPSPTYSLPSQPYEAQQTTEFGDEVSLVPVSGPSFYTVSLGMDDWAIRSDYMTQTSPGVWAPNSVGAGSGVNMDANGFYMPLTLSLYNVNNSGPLPTIGSTIVTETITGFIPWRPENNPSNNSEWIAPDGSLHYGIYSTVSFNLQGTGVTSLPSQLIYGLSFNTTDYGTPSLGGPTGVLGPYDSLNFALLDGTGVTVGSEVNPGTVFWNTSTAAWYTDGGAAGVGIFRQDQNWAPYIPVAEFTATETPEPISMIFFGTGIVSVWGYVARRRMQRS